MLLCRYVREWLGSMVCSGIIEARKVGDKELFYLPPHRRPVLSGEGINNAAPLTWILPVIAQAHNDLLQCFKMDGPAGCILAH